MKKLMVATLLLFSVPNLHAAKLNEPAPPFTLKTSDGKGRTLEDYRGRVLFINFWASWCAPCQRELPELDKLASDLETEKFSLIAVNIDKERSKAEALLQKLRIGISNMEILWDPASTAVSAFNADTMPTSFIVDGSGKVRVIHNGFHNGDPEKWRKEIGDLLKTAEK